MPNGTKGLLLFDFLQVTLYFQIPFDFLDLFTLKSSGLLLKSFTSFSICLVFLFASLCIKSNVYVQWLSWQVLEVFPFEAIVDSLT